MRGSSTGDPASHRTQDKRSHPASGAQTGTGRNALRPETVAEMRGASEKRPSAAIMLGRRLRIQRNLGQRNKPHLKYAQRSTSYLFRGMHRHHYGLVPSISRERADGRGYDPKDEKIVFKIIKNEGLMFIERGDLSDIDLLALSQHFGSPTRLLDWTTNPLVALYFSIFSGRTIDENADGIVYVYKSETEEFIRSKYDLNTKDDGDPLFPQKLFSGKVRFILPKFIDARIKNQNGLFSIQQDPTVSFARNCDRERLSYILVPRKIKVTLARYLHGLGVTHDFIMPGFAGFCETVAYRHHYNNGIRSKNLDMEEVDAV